MGILETVGAATKQISLAGSVLSLADATQAFVFGQNLPKGIAGFLFDIPESTSVTYTAQITDHYLQDNFTVQDHAAIEPIKLELTGIVSELVYTKTRAAEYAETVLNNLAPLNVLKPGVAQQAQEYISQAEQTLQALEQTLNQAKDLFGLLSPDEQKLAERIGIAEDVFARFNRQQRAFVYFQFLFNARTLLSVETPYGTFENMMIESFNFTQDESTVDSTSITVNFKQIRTVSVSVGTGKLIGRIKQQKAPPVAKGTQQGTSALGALTGISG